VRGFKLTWDRQCGLWRYTQLGICFAREFKPDFSTPNPFSIVYYMGVVPIINELISESSLTDAMAKAIQHSLDLELALADTNLEGATVTTPRGNKTDQHLVERQERTKLRMLKQITQLLRNHSPTIYLGRVCTLS
jgi:hypothetical protein